jgi:hypothetical protein
MPPGQELPGELLGDRVPFDQSRQQALAEQLHDRVSVPVIRDNYFCRVATITFAGLGRPDGVW